MDSQSFITENEYVVMEIDDIDLHYNFQYKAQDYGQEANYENFQEQLLKSLDFEEYLEETLSRSARIYEERVEAEKAMEIEKFLKEAYDNLLKMECKTPSGGNTEDQRKETEKFLKESYNNMLHMFDDISKQEP
ncbi:hypothetical protein PTKIN_Ptkin13bG0025500 [Pterospermum kingtungense]